MALLMKPACEECGKGLAMDGVAMICSYECTFCTACGDAMKRRCLNCGGELVLRPKRDVAPTPA